MIVYLATPSGPLIRNAIETLPYLGLLTSQRSGDKPPVTSVWAVDNGCFAKSWKLKQWLSFLDRIPRTAIWAAVPDVVGSHEMTIRRWHCYWHRVERLGHKPAFVAQDGCTADDIPLEAHCVFIGGTTEFKLSDTAYDITQRAISLGMMTHMGRVNSGKRLKLAHEWGMDTVDGTFFARCPAPEALGRLADWYEGLGITDMRHPAWEPRKRTLNKGTQ